MSEDIRTPRGTSKTDRPSELAAAGPAILAEIIALPELAHDSHRSVPLPPAPSPFKTDRADRDLRARRRKNRLATIAVYGTFVLAMIPLASLVFTVVSRGAERFDTTFFTNSMRNIVGDGGGALHALVGTLEITGLAALISVPIGLMTAIYLVEYGRGRLARAVTFFVDVMTGIPSIVAGLFAYALFLLVFGPGSQNGVAGAIALSVLMIPVVVRSCEEMLRLVPNELREASLALGVPRWRTITKVVLPTSMAGIATGVMLAVARVIGETAPLLVAVGFTQSMNYSLTDGPIMTLPVFVYNSYMSQGVDAAAYVDRAWTGALTLILIVMALNLVARLIASRFRPKGSR
ncbi:phosphate ABC transporter permease PstA [Actinomyces minihominis]|uniref:phosphate ABC transporter permease PstA n=1 Tax=Actinomyces minihominis TaxID=2002838 RepID=UPI000C0885E3|nr:phosphate ABC transporter permease PstA [Actinomyces minihominis]